MPLFPIPLWLTFHQPVFMTKIYWRKSLIKAHFSLLGELSRKLHFNFFQLFLLVWSAIKKLHQKHGSEIQIVILFWLSNSDALNKKIWQWYTHHPLRVFRNIGDTLLLLLVISWVELGLHTELGTHLKNYSSFRTCSVVRHLLSLIEDCFCLSLDYNVYCTWTNLSICDFLSCGFTVTYT